MQHVAAGLAYYMIFSITPLVLIIISVAGFFLEIGEVSGTFLRLIDEILGPQIGTLIENMILGVSNGSAGTVTTLVSVGFVLWGGAKLIFHLGRAFDQIHFGREIKELGFHGVLDPRIRSFINLGVMTVLVILSFLAALAVPLLLNFFYRIIPLPETLIFLIQSVTILLLMAIVFMVTYRTLGNKQVSWKAAFIAALASAFVFIILNALFGIYISNFSATSLYGAAGSVLALLLWFYWSAQLLLYGAIFSSVLEEK
jgi:membrane protein